MTEATHLLGRAARKRGLPRLLHPRSSDPRSDDGRFSTTVPGSARKVRRPSDGLRRLDARRARRRAGHATRLHDRPARFRRLPPRPKAVSSPSGLTSPIVTGSPGSRPSFALTPGDRPTGGAGRDRFPACPPGRVRRGEAPVRDAVDPAGFRRRLGCGASRRMRRRSTRCARPSRKCSPRALTDAPPEATPETTPGVSAAERLRGARMEVVESCDGFLRREAIAVSLSPAERIEILRGMVLTRATDNRLKAFFTGGEVRYKGSSFRARVSARSARRRSTLRRSASAAARNTEVPTARGRATSSRP